VLPPGMKRMSAVSRPKCGGVVEEEGRIVKALLPGREERAVVNQEMTEGWREGGWAWGQMAMTMCRLGLGVGEGVGGED